MKNIWSQIKAKLTIRNIVLFIAIVYVVTSIERALDNNVSQTEIMREHTEEYVRLLDGMNEFERKINEYETKKIQNTLDIIGMSSVERDSLRAMFNPQ